MRLDKYLSNKQNISRNKAQALINSGNVFVNEKKIQKQSFEVDDEMNIVVHSFEEIQYVARSAIKLKKFLEENPLDINGKIALDIGSSTGGFCQVLLEKNIWKIYAVDVGTSQLHSILRENPKIISIENTDIRNFKTHQAFDIITCDVSFISLELILESIISLANINTQIILLFKPQFEVWKKYINKKWVVKNEKIIKITLNNFLQACRNNWLKILLVEKSKLEWENGNEEIFILLKKS